MENKVINNEVVKYIKFRTNDSKEMGYRSTFVFDKEVVIVYNETVTNTEMMSSLVFKSIQDIAEFEETKKLLEVNKLKVFNKDGTFKVKDLFYIIKNKLDHLKVLELFKDEDDIFYYLYSGFTLVIVGDKILAVETKSFSDRSISEPSTEKGLKGPKDCFTENYVQNIGQIRKRIKTSDLKLEESIVGRRSKTKVGILYISDICKYDIIDKLKNKINDIDIDAIIDSNTISEYIINDKNTTIFPTVISTERPDLVCKFLYEGRCVIVVENSPFVLVLPTFIADFFKSPDDYYEKSKGIYFTRIIRYIAFFITLFLPAIYISLTTFNQEAIPTKLLISFANQRAGVPAPASLEAVLMMVAFEILREGDFRVPGIAGSTLSIVGALILGEAAVSAGVVSPIMIIVIATTTISGLIFTDINMSFALRYWRSIFLIFASLSGMIGVIISGVIFLIKIVSVDEFKFPYTYPFAPLNLDSIKGDIFNRSSYLNLNKRDKILTNNLVRSKKVGSLDEN